MTSTVKNQIDRLREFLENCLGKKIIDYSLQALTKPGDNYGSIIQALTVTLADNHSDNEQAVREFIFCAFCERDNPSVYSIIFFCSRNQKY